MKKALSLILALLVFAALMTGCGGGGQQTTPPAESTPQATTPAPTVSAPQEPENGEEEEQEPSGAPTGAPELNPDAAARAEEAYAFIADLAEEASAYDPAAAEYKYNLNCHDPAASAAGEFLYAWSDAVLVATEGAVYIEVGVANAFCTDGTMATLDNMITGSIDFNWTLPCYFKGYMPLTLAIQNPSLGIKNATVGAYAMWELYKNNADIQKEYEDDGVALFVWANNPSPLSYKGTSEITSISEITGNIRGNNGPAQMFISQVGANVYGCPIGDVYTNVSTGVINYLITDWHGIASFSLFDEGVLNYYLDTNVGSSAYCLMANDDVWAELEANGYADAIKSVSGDYLLNFVGIWEAYEARGREGAVANGGTIYAPNDKLADELQEVYDSVAEQWISETGGSAQAVYDQVAELVNKYNGIYS